jgi:hypothetical protein
MIIGRSTVLLAAAVLTGCAHASMPVVVIDNESDNGAALPADVMADFAFFDENAPKCPSLYAQISKRPEADARTAADHRDRRYVVVFEPTGMSAPGLRRGELPYPYRAVEGITDDGSGPCPNFGVDAYTYAVRFNRELARLLRSSH